MRTTRIYIHILLAVVATLAIPSAALAMEQSFPIGWYAGWNNIPGLYNTVGAEHVLLYTYWSDDVEDKLQVALDDAASVGSRIILDVRLGVNNLDATRLASVASQFSSHPALGGWYTADEPVSAPVIYTVATLQTAYNIVKQYSNKPVYMAFCTADLDFSTPATFKNAYDVMMFDQYPFQVGDAEFDDIEDEYFLIWRTYEGWKSRVQRARDQATAAGKPFYNILQAFGVEPAYGWNYRLPTKREERFMAYYSLLSAHADGLTSFCYFLTEGTVASPTTPYPYDGPQWLLDVGGPVNQELHTYGRALAAGAIGGGVSDTASDVDCSLYRDPTTGAYYLLSVNTESGGENVTFTLNVPEEFDFAVPMYEDGPPIPIINGQFTVSFDDYAVHNYQLTP